MKLVVKWGDEDRKFSEETPDFGIEKADAARINVFTEALLTERKVWEEFGKVTVDLVGGTKAVRWFFEQLNPLGRLLMLDEQSKLDDLVLWLTDVYREGISEASVLVNYFRGLERRSKTYRGLSDYREQAQSDSSAVWLHSEVDSSLRGALVNAKIKRYEHQMMPPDPNQAADNETVVGILQFDGKYVVTDRVKIN